MAAATMRSHLVAEATLATSRTVWLARILSVGAFLEAGIGVVLLVAPSALSSFLLRSPLSGAGVTIARLAGGALLGLGIACWYARGTPSTPAGLGVSRAFLAYNLVAAAILARACPPLPDGLPALGASVLHGLLAAALLTALLRPGRAHPPGHGRASDVSPWDAADRALPRR